MDMGKVIDYLCNQLFICKSIEIVDSHIVSMFTCLLHMCNVCVWQTLLGAIYCLIYQTKARNGFIISYRQALADFFFYLYLEKWYVKLVFYL